MSTHTCPHNGSEMRPGDPPFDYYCGTDGWLCPACREDRADRRNRELVEGLALAGLLAGASYMPRDIEDPSNRPAPIFLSLLDTARRLAGAMRAKRGGGEGS